MKFWQYPFLLLCLIGACKTTQEVTTQKQLPTTSTLTCILKSCKPGVPPSLYSYIGVGFEKIQPSKIIGKDTFQFQVPKKGHRFYYVGQEGKQKMPVILGEEIQVVLQGNCNTMRSATLPDSPINQAYNQVIQQITTFSNQSRQNNLTFQRATNDPAAMEKVKQDMKRLDEERLAYQKSLEGTQPFLAQLMGLTTYLSFQNNQGPYANEIDYFANTYFSQVDLKSPVYNNIPYVFEAFKNYSTTLGGQNIPETQLYQYFDQQLAAIPAEGQAYQYALGGIALGLQSKNHPGFAKYGQLFLSKYQSQHPYSLAISTLKEAVKKSYSYAKGSIAPDFTQNRPDGSPMNLSDLKGKVVLLDFWASWCGPCRRENPHVVKIYNKYKDKGFDILGISLDRKKDPWVKAIQKDGLVWHHVSDLKGWQNAIAKDYSVSSIPHTVLLDQEGRIIARNLRGASLENRLQQIFGE
ncbi:MAG: TlpA disulfide reductase family protein [Bacteroidota bacterium]